MKNLVLSFAFAVALISSTVVLNCLFPANMTETVDVNDLSKDNNQLCDMVFDENGNLISETVYKWDSKNNLRGEIISRTVCFNHPNTYAYNN